jgi:hypothetical protein
LGARDVRRRVFDLRGKSKVSQSQRKSAAAKEAPRTLMVGIYLEIHVGFCPRMAKRNGKHEVANLSSARIRQNPLQRQFSIQTGQSKSVHGRAPAAARRMAECREQATRRSMVNRRKKPKMGIGVKVQLCPLRQSILHYRTAKEGKFT